MLTIQIRQAKSNEVVFAKLTAYQKRIKRSVRRGFFRYGKLLLSTASKNILDTSKKTGRIYTRRIKGGAVRRHQASAAGETHANLSGTLRRSLSWKVPSASNTLFFGYGLNKPAPKYAKWVEFGHKNRNKTKPFVEARPSIQNTIDETKGDAERFLTQEVKKGLNES